jgi:WD40 repeat protein
MGSILPKRHRPACGVAKDFRELRTLRGHASFIFGDAAWNPEGTRLASVESDSMIRIWNVASEEVLGIKASKTLISSVAWSPDGRRLASCGDDGLVRMVMDLGLGRRQFTSYGIPDAG